MIREPNVTLTRTPPELKPYRYRIRDFQTANHRKSCLNFGPRDTSYRIGNATTVNSIPQLKSTQ